MSLYGQENLFSQAAREWLESRESTSLRVRYLKPRTLKTYRLEIEALTLFFGKMRLRDITNESIRSFQQKRADGARPFRHRRSPGHVNDEVAKLQKILGAADLWHLLADGYERLIEPFDQPRRVMTKGEEKHLFEVAASRPEFAYVYAYCMLSVNTSASGSELRGLRMVDVDLVGRTLQVNAESAKNPARVRTIPLVNDALWAATSLVARARGLGCTAPQHFLFPYKHGNTPYDPARHISDNGMQKQWHALRRAAGMPWLTGHVLRYQCITKLAEGNVDRITAKRVAGHITDKMWEKYSQVRMESIRGKMSDAFDSSSHRTEAASRAIPPRVELPQITIDLMNPTIQAEIARQVALAMQREREQVHVPAPSQPGPQLLQFPRNGNKHA